MKKTLLFTLCLFLTFNAFSKDDDIELPDLTTVVSGSEKEEKTEAVPAFSEAEITVSKPGELDPVLPVVDPDEEIVIVTAKGSEAVKQMFAEGKIGGGYPASFIGAFSVSRQYGSNPFVLSFNHTSAEGFGKNDFSKGFNSRDTAISVDKVFTKKPFKWEISGNYQNCGNGLQQQAQGIGALNQNTIGMKALFDWNIKNGFKFNTTVDTSFYYRFADVSDSLVAVEPWISGLPFYELTPEVSFSWHNSALKAGITGNYTLNTSVSEYLDTVNRGEFVADFGWHNSKIMAEVSAGIVFGNNMNGSKVAVPFNVMFEYKKDLEKSQKPLVLTVCGGIDSKQTNLAQSEMKYKFAAFKFMPFEQSDWNSKIEVSMPLSKGFSLNAQAEYRKTVFNNGEFIPVYDSRSLVNGIYGFEPFDRDSLRSVAEVAFSFKLFKARANYTANWFTIPALENAQTITIAAGVGKEEKWEVLAETSYSFDKKEEQPYINISSFIQVADGIKFELEVNDFLKLIGNTPRIYAGNYIANSGYVTLTAGFLF